MPGEIVQGRPSGSSYGPIGRTGKGEKREGGKQTPDKRLPSRWPRGRAGPALLGRGRDERAWIRPAGTGSEPSAGWAADTSEARGVSTNAVRRAPGVEWEGRTGGGRPGDARLQCGFGEHARGRTTG